MQKTSAARSTVHISAPSDCDDLEGAILAGVRDRAPRRPRAQIGQLAAVQILAHALVDARIAALQVEQRAHDIDVEVLRLRTSAQATIWSASAQHQLGELCRRRASRRAVSRDRRTRRPRIGDQTVGQARQRRSRRTGRGRRAFRASARGGADSSRRSWRRPASSARSRNRPWPVRCAVGAQRAQIRCVLPAPDWP